MERPPYFALLPYPGNRLLRGKGRPYDLVRGLCWHKIKFEGLWGYSGEDPGVATYMFFNPRTKTGIITFQNNHNGDLFLVVRKLYAVADNL